jgi:hypothetical protein
MTRWSELQLSDALLLVCEMTDSRLRLLVLQPTEQGTHVVSSTELALAPRLLSDSKGSVLTSSLRKAAPRYELLDGASLAKRQGAVGRSRRVRA